MCSLITWRNVGANLIDRYGLAAAIALTRWKFTRKCGYELSTACREPLTFPNRVPVEDFDGEVELVTSS